MIPIVGTGEHRPDSWSSFELWRLWSQWAISISPLTHSPTHHGPKTPAQALRQLDPGSGFITSLVTTTTKQQIVVTYFALVCCPYTISWCIPQDTTLHYALHTTICIKSEGKYTKEWRFQEKNLPPLSFSLSWVTSILLLKKKKSILPPPLCSPPPFVLPSPLLSLAPSRQLWSAQKLIFRVLTTMFFLPTAGFHLQSTGGQYLG